MNQTISIIVPAYNAAKYLNKSLESILCQTWSNLEIIVVDDASSDQTASIISSFAEKDPRIRFLHKETNEGVSFARNDALDLATGEYLMFVDGDDWIEPETCRKALDAIVTHGADMVMWSYIREMGSESRPKRIFDQDQVFEATEVREKLYRKMVGAYGQELSQPENADALCTVWGKLYRRSLIETNSIRFPDIRKIGTYEDGLFNLEVLRHVRKAVFLNDHLYHYRRGQDASLTTAYNPKMPGLWKNLFSLIRQHLEWHDLDETFHQALSNRIALSLIPLGINEAENKAGPAAVIRGLRTIIRDPEYRAALGKLDFSRLPIHWRLYFTCARLNCAEGVYLLLLVIQKIRGR